MEIIASIAKRFQTHFTGQPLQLEQIAYVERGNDYVCGVVSDRGEVGVVLRCVGEVAGKLVDYTLSVDADLLRNVTKIKLAFVHPVELELVLEPGDDQVVARPSMMDTGKAAGCIALAGGKSAYECWYRCKRSGKCWRECAKEKGISLGLEILGCLALP